MDYMKATLVIAMYEMAGTFVLASAMNATNANAYGVPLVLFLLYKIAYPMTGAHFNPSVTIGVYINTWNTDLWKHNTIQASVMIFSQILGAIFGMEIWKAVLEEFDGQGNSIYEDIPYLLPTTPAYWQAGVFEIFVTFCFVLANVITKDKTISQYICGEQHWLAAASVCISLCAMMLIAGAHSGALINPAMSISQFIFGETQSVENDHFWGTYMLCPILGGILAGFYARAHCWMLSHFEDSDEAPAKADKGDKKE